MFSKWFLKATFIRRNFSTKWNIGSMEQKILQETEISREHLTPEIALYLITPRCRLFYKPIIDGNDKVFTSDPFWGFYWPGGQALSRYILDNPNVVSGKRVLDVGSGCGATSLAAVISGAKYAVANDIDPTAALATHLNMHVNKLTHKQVHTDSDNLIGTTVHTDVLLLGDVFYDEDFAVTLLPWLEHLHANGTCVLIGDPGRHGLTANRMSFMKKLATYYLTENSCIENNGFRHVNVWRFKREFK